MPVLQTTSWAGPSIITSPFRVGFSAYCTTWLIGVVPPLRMAPIDFSSRVVRPPSIFPGDGSVPRISAPIDSIPASVAAVMARMRFPISLSAARRTRICSDPSISGVSEIITVPPAVMSKSEATPSEGLAVIPEIASEPPQDAPRINSAASTGSVRAAAASLRSFSASTLPLATLAVVPPSSWILSVSNLWPDRVSPAAISFGVHSSQPSPTSSTPATLGLAQNPTMVRTMSSVSLPR